MSPDFDFEDASGIIEYLAELGVSHLYTSPYLQAAEGSSHGYDVVDPTKVNCELGGAIAHEKLCLKLKEIGMGHMIDIVPNHMAIAGKQNPWWWDVLENGPSSHYATFFDVDWEFSEERWQNKILLPVLGDHYGRILENKEFKLEYNDGVFILKYHEHEFPIDPSSLADLLAKAARSSNSDLLAFIANSHARLPRPTVTAREDLKLRHRDKAVLVNILAKLCQESPDIKKAIDDEVKYINSNPDTMDKLLELQNYRLAFWKTANRDLGYRRFFDIMDLVGLRVEDIEVFHCTHFLPINWAKKGWVDGFRIDHPDGLSDPVEYFRRLREVCPNVWIVIEKILSPNEKIPSEWPVSGTTGYDFLNISDRLFVDSKSEASITSIYEDFIGRKMDFKNLLRECKRLVLTEILGSELNRLVSLFADICERHRCYRDYTRYELKEALCETIVCFPVYRSYISFQRNFVTSSDENVINEAINIAKEKRSDLDPRLFEFLHDLLLLRVDGTLEGQLIMRFQQLTGPAMALGLEDTVFYRFNRLISLNEVGSDPSRFGISVGEFHKYCQESVIERPMSLLATTTHDTKRSEDVRSRISVLSEIPEQWKFAVNRWAKQNQKYKFGDLPDRNTEYLYYQTLVGTWPIEIERIQKYMEKAVREAKEYTSWTQQNKEYEDSLRDFINNTMNDKTFRDDMEEFVNSILYSGRVNSLSQTILKLTSPGIPDIYQGNELWDLSLVDPDNRRKVDFDLRKKLLKEIKTLSPEEILDRMDEGIPKLWVTYKTLQIRKDHPKLFGPDAKYKSMVIYGPKAEHVIAFMREEGCITVAQRLSIKRGREWGDTIIGIPKGTWKNIFTGEKWGKGHLLIADLLKRFPIALLIKEE